jgi:hypothetical protein
LDDPNFEKDTEILMPIGVNFGSWLSLEDYFLVGPTGADEVATPNHNIAVQCLLPLHTGGTGQPKFSIVN